MVMREKEGVGLRSSLSRPSVRACDFWIEPSEDDDRGREELSQRACQDEQS